ncbi:MAG TPA: hypothetical protein VM686_26455 [Polyangiaceae bacterium]|nr:hypothetical protein [Polyangiaceae bacterium]
MLAFSLAAIACGLTSRSDDDRPSPASSGATSAGATSAGTTSTGGGGGNTDRANGGVETHDGGGDGGVGGGGSDDVDYDPGYCGLPLTFRLERVEVDAGITLCNGLPGGIDPIWFWLLDSEGETFPAFPGCSDKLCGSCSGGCLLLGRFSSPVPAEGIEQQWAVHQLLDDSCDGSACKYPICAPAGEYIARFCGYPVKSADGIGGSAEPATRSTILALLKSPSSQPASRFRSRCRERNP